MMKRSFIVIALVVVLLFFLRMGVLVSRVSCDKPMFSVDRVNCSKKISADKEGNYEFWLVVFDKIFNFKDTSWIVYRYNDARLPVSHFGILILDNNYGQMNRIIKSRQYSMNMDSINYTSDTKLSRDEVVSLLNKEYFNCRECSLRREVYIGINKAEKNSFFWIFPNAYKVTQMMFYEK